MGHRGVGVDAATDDVEEIDIAAGLEHVAKGDASASVRPPGSVSSAT